MTMTRMTKTISVRLDEDAERALRALESRGLGQSEAVRGALVESARRRTPEALRAEAQRLMATPAYRREVAEVQAFMEDPDDPW